MGPLQISRLGRTQISLRVSIKHQLALVHDHVEVFLGSVLGEIDKSLLVAIGKHISLLRLERLHSLIDEDVGYFLQIPDSRGVKVHFQGIEVCIHFGPGFLEVHSNEHLFHLLHVYFYVEVPEHSEQLRSV